MIPLEIRSDSVNEGDRSVECVIATGKPVSVFDRSRRQVIDEMLVVDGMRSSEQVPLLANHQRKSLDDVYGSVRNIQINSQTEEITARAFFAELPEGDPERVTVDRAWAKVVQKHQREVSAGYRIREATVLAPRTTKTIMGRSYTAQSRPLRVVTSWELREVSLVPVGEDPASVMRSLDSQIEEDDSMPVENQAPNEETRSETQTPEQQSTGSVTETLETRSLETAPSVDADQVRQQGAAEERERISGIRTRGLENNVSEEDIQRAINDNLTVEQFAVRTLDNLRSSRQEPVQGPAIHSTSQSQVVNRDSLAVGMMIRGGLAPDAEYFSDPAHRQSGLPAVMTQDVNSDDRQRAMEYGHRMARLPLIDVCRAVVEWEGNGVPMDQAELIERAFSNADFSTIMTNSMSAQVLAGYVEAEDSTMGWTVEQDVPNFLQNERNHINKFDSMKKLGPGGTAEHLSTDSEQETYKAKRYAAQFAIDEQDIINDQFGVQQSRSPVELGYLGRATKIDLVYAVLLANANMRDGNALFDAANHSNLVTSGSALSEATIEAALSSLMNQRIANRPLNLRGRFLLLPPELEWTAARIIESAERDGMGGSGTKNPLRGSGLTIRADSRLSAAGVIDPDSGNSYAGSATNWFLTARPGESGAKTIEVGYVRSTGRTPRVRSFNLDRGQYGMGWDISLDVGVKALDWRGMYKATGAA